MSTYVINAWGKNLLSYALTIEADSLEQVEAAIKDLDLVVLPTGYGELLNED